MAGFKPTGFYAFWFERVINDYILDVTSKVDVDTSKKLPHQNKYANMWNSAYANYPGSSNYLQFEKTILPSRAEYFRCFLYYYAKNANQWKVNNIVSDDFKYYYDMEIKYNDIRSTFKTDLLETIKFIKCKGLEFKEVFYAKNGLPRIYTLFFQNKITIFSLVILENLFSIFSKLNVGSIGFVEENKLNVLRIIFDKFY